MASAYKTFEEKTAEVKNSRLRTDMGKLINCANAELKLFNEKLSGQ